MVLLRSVIFFAGLIVSTVVFGIVIGTIGWLMPPHWRSVLAAMWGLVNLKLLKWICALDYAVRGRDNFPQGSCIVLSKHQSAWETIAFRWILPFAQAWVLKRELMKIPVFGWALAADNSIAIDRTAGRKAARQVIEQGLHQLKQGRNVVIFPEGTRVAPGSRKKYGLGGALLAAKSGLPVVPVAHNAGVFWRRRDLKKYPGTIQVVIGPPIESKNLSAAQINARTEEWIESTMLELVH